MKNRKLTLAFLSILILSGKPLSSSYGQESTVLTNGSGGGFVELVGASNDLERVSYGLQFSINNDKIKGSVTSNEVHPDGSFASNTLALRGKILGPELSKLTPYGDYSYYRKVKGAVVFSLSDGTTFSGILKGSVDINNGGYQTSWNGTFSKSGFQSVDYSFDETLHAVSADYSW